MDFTNISSAIQIKLIGPDPSVHELRKILRKIKLNAPWRPIVGAQSYILFATEPKTALHQLQKHLPGQVRPLKEFYDELIDLLDAIPRNTDQNHELILQIDNITKSVSIAISDIQALEQKLLTAEPDNAEKLVEELKAALDRINQAWQNVETLYIKIRTANR